MKGLSWFLKIDFNPHDIWIGIYWKRYSVIGFWDIYICIIPMFPIRIYQGVEYSI